MDARLLRATLAVASLALFAGATYPTPNFRVETADPQLARELGQTAERLRSEMAILWLGEPLPNWSQPCPMVVKVGEHLGAGGATSFMFDKGEVFGWRMNIQGSRERLLDSVLPHEITHMIFASHFRQPLPRWADEGGATTVEHHSERDKHRRMLVQFLKTGRGISFSQMFAMTEYPPDIMPLYAQGYSLVDFLIQKGGRRRYIQFLQDGLDSQQWEQCVAKHYGIEGLAPLQNDWLGWVKQGSPLLESPDVPPLDPQSPQLYADRTLPATPSASPAAVAQTAASSQPAGLVPIQRALPSHGTVAAADRGVPGQFPSSIYRLSAAERQAGWRRPGEDSIVATSQPDAPTPNSELPTPSSPESSPAPVRSQVAHPQPLQPARQVILQWSK